MARLINTLFVISIGTWFSLVVSEPSAAQQPNDLLNNPLRSADLGLEKEIPSAIDLVGPAGGSAGRNRADLVHRLQCWIDGDESCSVADLNDPGVRAIRRFLVQRPNDRGGAVAIHFPDQTRITVRLARVSDLDPNDWDQRVYETVVLPDTVQAPGLREVPSSPDEFEKLADEGTPAIRAALARLKERF